MGRKTFLSMFGWMEMKGNKWWGSSIFSPCPPKCFLPKMERKLKGKIENYFWTKMPTCNCTWDSSMLLFFTPFFSPPGRCLPSFFFFFLLIYYASDASLLFFFFFSFDLLGKLVQSSFFSFSFSFFCFFFFFFFFLLLLFRCDFFYGHDFYFLINLGD